MSTPTKTKKDELTKVQKIQIANEKHNTLAIMMEIASLRATLLKEEKSKDQLFAECWDSLIETGKLLSKKI